MTGKMITLLQFAALGVLMARTGFDPVCTLCATALSIVSFYEGMKVKKGGQDNEK